MKYLKNALLLLGFLALGLGAGQAWRYGVEKWAAEPTVKTVDLEALGLAMSSQPVMISLSTCPVCQRASRWLADNKIEHIDLVVDKSDTARRTATALDVQVVPVFLIGKKQITGFDPEMLAALLKQP